MRGQISKCASQGPVWACLCAAVGHVAHIAGVCRGICVHVLWWHHTSSNRARSGGCVARCRGAVSEPPRDGFGVWRCACVWVCGDCVLCCWMMDVGVGVTVRGSSSPSLTRLPNTTHSCLPFPVCTLLDNFVYGTEWPRPRDLSMCKCSCVSAAVAPLGRLAAAGVAVAQPCGSVQSVGGKQCWGVEILLCVCSCGTRVVVVCFSRNHHPCMRDVVCLPSSRGVHSVSYHRLGEARGTRAWLAAAVVCLRYRCVAFP